MILTPGTDAGLRPSSISDKVTLISDTRVTAEPFAGKEVPIGLGNNAYDSESFGVDMNAKEAPLAGRSDVWHSDRDASLLRGGLLSCCMLMLLAPAHLLCMGTTAVLLRLSGMR